MIRRLFCSSTLLGPLVAAIVLPAPLAAQTEAAASRPAQANETVCMARAMRDVAQVPHAKRGQLFRVVTVERGAKALEERGFVRVDCAVTDLARSDKRSEWRDEICELAGTGNEAVQIQLARAIGEKPAVLCAMAEQVAGPWVRKARKKPETRTRE